MPRLAATVLLGLLLAACSLGTRGDDIPAFVDGAGRVDYLPEERVAAPALTGTTLDGTVVSLDDVEGPVVLNFWASWCGPCATEAPHLAAISNEYDGRVTVLGVNQDSSVANALTFERDHAIPFASLHDPANEVAAALGRFGPAGLPTTILLDAEDRVASRMFGAVSARELVPRLDALLAG